MAHEAIVLVGGLGTRLRPVVGELPKPLAPVAGQPFLARVLDRLAAGGLRRVVLAAGYRADLLMDAIGADWHGMRIDYSIEDEPLGTGGAVARAGARIEGDGVHVLNGDTYLDYDFDAFEAAVRREGVPLGIALAHVPDTARYGAVLLDGARVVAFTEKGVSGAGWINGGAYFLSREAIAALPPYGTYSLEDAVLAPAARARSALGFRDTAGFIDIGIPDDYRAAQARFAAT